MAASGTAMELALAWSEEASVHGATRFGANSLLDLVAFGQQAADTTAELAKPTSLIPAYAVKLPSHDKVLHHGEAALQDIMKKCRDVNGVDGAKPWSH